MEKICLELPLCRVNDNDPWASSDYINEHFPKGCFIIDDGYNYRFAWHNGQGYINEMGIDRDLVQGAIVENARHDVMEEVENRLQQIARLVGETKDEVVRSETRVVDQMDSQRGDFTLIMEAIKGLHDAMPKSCGGGVNILDVAKSYAVIQKPELIKELKQ